MCVPMRPMEIKFISKFTMLFIVFVEGIITFAASFCSFHYLILHRLFKQIHLQPPTLNQIDCHSSIRDSRIISWVVRRWVQLLWFISNDSLDTHVSGLKIGLLSNGTYKKTRFGHSAFLSALQYR